MARRGKGAAAEDGTLADERGRGWRKSRRERELWGLAHLSAHSGEVERRRYDENLGVGRWDDQTYCDGRIRNHFSLFK
jgi:hypothetical protein